MSEASIDPIPEIKPVGEHKVVKLVPRNANASIVEKLEAALAKAKNGELIGLVLYLDCPDTYTVTWAGVKNRAELIGNLEITKLHLVSNGNIDV